MNVDQLCRQVQKLIRDLTWPGGEPVMRPESVVVTARGEEAMLGVADTPFAVILPKAARSDPEEPTILEQSITVRLVQVHEGDATGEAALIGAHQHTSGDTRGRGLLDIDRRIWEALALLTADDGVPIVHRGGGAGLMDPGGKQREPITGLVARDYDFRAVIAAEHSYPRPTALRASVAGGTVSLSWKLPSHRFDYRRVILRRASGSTAPATPSSGTGIVLGGTPDGAAITSHDDLPTSGTWSYALFGVFDELGRSEDGQFSDDAATRTAVVA